MKDSARNRARTTDLLLEIAATEDGFLFLRAGGLILFPSGLQWEVMLSKVMFSRRPFSAEVKSLVRGKQGLL